jgi:hypothetical protein
MTPEQFFERSYKWFALAFFVLFLFKSVQSCNRNMLLSIDKKTYIHTIDSLDKKYYRLEKESTATIDQLRFELRLQSEKAGEADKRATAVQSVAEKMRANTTTTINVKGAEVDTTKNKK